MNNRVLKSGTVRLRVWGMNACFTRPEMKVERVSYDVMTPSAARGILEAIHWKPAIRWRIGQIDILAPIRWESVRRNEVGSVMSPVSNGLFIEDQRQQRAGLFLRNVDYVIHACFEITALAGPDDSVAKHQEMFTRRAEKGQCFHRPYLGCREFAADFALVPPGESSPTPRSYTWIGIWKGWSTSRCIYLPALSRPAKTGMLNGKDFLLLRSLCDYKEALRQISAMDRATDTETRRAKSDKRPIDPNNINSLYQRYLARIPYKANGCRYHSFVTYFSNLQRLGWVESSGKEAVQQQGNH